MAVEILAAVECILAGEGHAVWQLGAGLIERATRLPGGAARRPSSPTCRPWPRCTCSGRSRSWPAAAASTVLPAEITRSLRDRWRAACAAYPPAAAFAAGAAELVARADPLV